MKQRRSSSAWEIQEMMDLVTAATFQLLIAEGVIAVVGQLDKEGKDDPKATSS